MLKGVEVVVQHYHLVVGIVFAGGTTLWGLDSLHSFGCQTMFRNNYSRDRRLHHWSRLIRASKMRDIISRVAAIAVAPKRSNSSSF